MSKIRIQESSVGLCFSCLILYYRSLFCLFLLGSSGNVMQQLMKSAQRDSPGFGLILSCSVGSCLVPLTAIQPVSPKFVPKVVYRCYSIKKGSMSNYNGNCKLDRFVLLFLIVDFLELLIC